jgi:anti-sigma-K factor RskA
MNDEHDAQELVGAYVLDALPVEEVEAFEVHLTDCASCRAEVRELQSVADVLPLALTPVAPPEALRDRIMAAVEADETSRPALTALRGGVPERMQGRNLLRMPSTYLTVAAVAVIAALGVWNLHLQSQVTQQQAAVKMQRMVSQALMQHASVYPVGPTSPNSNAAAYMVQPQGRATAYLIVKDLPKPSSNRVYQLWLMQGNVPRSEGTFTSAGSDPEIVHMPTALTGYGRTAVSVEPGPSGSSHGPTGKIVLLGKLGV